MRLKIIIIEISTAERKGRLLAGQLCCVETEEEVMERVTESSQERRRKLRTTDPFMDRRCGEDRRNVYSLEYFEQGNPDRRNSIERRENIERRHDCVRVSEWSSACPDAEEFEKVKGTIKI
jgi:hypothetical protein